jgi:hypothetical protein
MCEEFECTPDIAVDLPFGISSRIMSLRDYSQVRTLIENSDSEKLKMTPGIERVLLIQAKLDMGIEEED